MPLYYYSCPGCGADARRILTPAEAKSVPQKCTCGVELQRRATGPTCQCVETLDNGIMTKRLERLADAEKLFSERNEVTRRKQSGEE